MKFTFNGKTFSGQGPEPNGDHIGEALKRDIAIASARAAADQRVIQRAKAEQAQREKDEQRLIAKLIGRALEEEENG
jgi:hypothetical protein